MPTAVPDLISKKRDGEELSPEEIGTFVHGVVDGTVAECQTGAMLMAMYLQGLTRKEISTMTLEMKNSGTTLTWPDECQGCLVDKHSTGGVGDKVSLVLAPALAACGAKVPMISGRGLAHTGGTLDKLESIPGYTVSLTADDMARLMESPGCFIAGQTGNICPADKKLYATRDVTSTVGHQGLIIGSIISKKAAENINTLVLDVKTGSGAFMSDKDQAMELAKSMVECSKDIGINTVALLTDMESPIGDMVGNALEVAESVWCLQGKGSDDLLDLVVELGGHALHAHDSKVPVDEAKQKIIEVITNGSALSKFKAMIEGQGVSSQVASDLCDLEKDIWGILPSAKHKTELKCPRGGYVHKMTAMPVAKAAHKLGGGRNAPGESINLSVGIQLLVDIGDEVTEGKPWVRVHHEDASIPHEVMTYLSEALVIGDDKVPGISTRLLKVFQ